MKKLMIASCAMAMFIACQKENKTAANSVAAVQSSAAAPAAAPAAEQKICNLGINILETKGMKIEDSGDMGCMITTAEYVMSVERPGEFSSKTLKEAKTNAVETYDGDQLKETKLPNGFILAYHNKGEMGDNWFVDSYLTINKKSFVVRTSQSTQAQQNAAVEAIKTIHGS